MKLDQFSKTKLAVAFLALGATPAVNASVFDLDLTAWTSVEVESSGANSDLDGPSSGNVSALVMNSLNNSSGFASSNGSSNGQFNMSVESYDNAEADATFTQSYQVTNDGVDQFFDFTFNIENGSIYTYCEEDDGYGYGYGYGSGGCSGSATAGYNAEIFLNGLSIWSSSASIFTDPNISIFASSGTSLGTYSGGSSYGWGDQTFTIGLGAFAANTVFSIDYEVSLYGNTTDGGLMYAQFGDPSGFGSTPFSSVPASPVPVPASLGLFGLGLGALTLLRRRRKVEVS